MFISFNHDELLICNALPRALLNPIKKKMVISQHLQVESNDHFSASEFEIFLSLPNPFYGNDREACRLVLTTHSNREKLASATRRWIACQQHDDIALFGSCRGAGEVGRAAHGGPAHLQNDQTRT